MAQIAQQDHLFVEVDSLEESVFTDEQKAELLEKHKQGVLLDVVLVDKYKMVSKILAIEVADTGMVISYMYETDPHAVNLGII